MKKAEAEKSNLNYEMIMDQLVNTRKEMAANSSDLSEAGHGMVL